MCKSNHDFNLPITAIFARSPTRHALRILHNHGMGDAALQTIFRAFVVSKLLYAASAWWGFTTAADRQRVEAVLRRGVRAGLYEAERPTIAQLVESNDIVHHCQ